MVFRHTRNDEDVLISLSVAPKLPVSVELALVATTMLFAFFGSLLERLEEGGGGSHLRLVSSPPPSGQCESGLSDSTCFSSVKWGSGEVKTTQKAAECEN